MGFAPKCFRVDVVDGMESTSIKAKLSFKNEEKCL